MLTSTTLNSRRQQRGITLIEVSIGLIIAAIIAAAAFIAFQNNSRRAEVRDNVRDITEIISETKQKVGLTTGYAGFVTADAQSYALVNAEALNSYEGAILLEAKVAANPDLAQLTWGDVPEDQCGDLVLSSLEGITAVAGNNDTDVDVINGNLTLAEVTAVCTPDANDLVELKFTFGRR